MKLPFVQIDAFAGQAFHGNPAAVMPLDAWLPDRVLQAIAGENNLSETAFLVPDASGASDYELRWFTPAAEVALCGHATLASGHYLLSQGRGDTARFATRQAGMLEVRRVDDARYALDLPAWIPEAKPLPEIVAALGVVAVETLWHPRGYPLVIVADEAAVRAARPDGAALAALGPLVAIVSAPGERVDFVSRVFTPAFDIPEDPVTGSAHAVAAPYWVRRVGKAELTAFQASARGGELTCTVAGDRVILGGRCVTVIEGVFLL